MSAEGIGYTGQTQDPLQGYDIKVTTSASDTPSGGTSAAAPPLIGAFTSLMFKIVNQTETYLPLNSRIPRMLDGEVIIVWSLEQGLVALNIVENTFGTGFYTGFSQGRDKKVPRSLRFDIKFESNAMIAPTDNASNDSTINLSGGSTFINKAQARSGVQYIIKYCRVDTCSFGVAAGRHVVANSWQGTGQHITSVTGTSAAPAAPAPPAAT